MFLLSKLKIAHRVMLLGALAVTGIAVIAGILLVQRQVEAQSREVGYRLAAREAEFASLSADFLAARLNEKDFLLAREMAASSAFEATADAATARLETLRSAAEPALSAELEEIEARFAAYRAAFASLVTVNGELGLDQSTGLEGAMRSAVHDIEEQLQGVEDTGVLASMLMLRRHEKDFILRRDPKYIVRHAEEAETFTGLVRKLYRPGAQRQRVMERFDVYRNAFRLYAEASLRETAARAAVSAAHAAIEPAKDRATALLAAGRTDHVAATDASAARTIMVVAALIAGAVAALLLAVWLVGRSIVRPIGQMTAAMRTLAGGRTEIAVPGLERRDEIGAMAAALEVFRQAAIDNRRLEEQAEAERGRAEAERVAIQAAAEAEANERLMQATGGLAGGLRRLADGDLDFALVEPFSPEFEGLRHDLNQALSQLGGTLAQIATAGITIDGGSREISASAETLSGRTERQAAALEETAAALDEITANVTQAAERAQEARDVATRANANAERTAELVGGTVGAMERIEQSSRRISSIIGVIDEIAFQTNLLALNAGVEAARAGEAGRGFAVVAQEVRELAQRSAVAAREIKDLIRQSSSEVEDGVGIVRNTGTALEAIGSEVKAIHALMEAIAVSAREQSLGLREVNQAVNQMDQGTQQNAAMVEENNAASAVLAAQAERLRDLVAAFRLPEATEARDDVADEQRRVLRFSRQAG
ncbi:methyl-accepting chemotaxis protein [Rhizobium sp. TRM96647]|uniref:methyl-accepting chemotaxis protein n=1 Tax=unclassified Rhizobium TaxID=2613769 RepID=UPI0021E97AB3|nr:MULTISPECIES: methyl-accepting chemotaxis protein [unclassified Rhizobium]MCV3738186.1 methyl-accepting chemotaxis protein [Rhizobium sp. TRM96647]MCV3760065.1 methyl-accepting chemotaxis protein [Rhizobium sp. TRM96650]